MEIYLLCLLAWTSGREQKMLTAANGKFQNVNEPLQETNEQYREEKPENVSLIL